MFVDRASPESRKKCLEDIATRGDVMSDFPRVLIFPEGTCTNQRALITFKHGPFYPGHPVQPVVVRYHFQSMDPSYPAVSPSLGGLALRVMCQVFNCMEVEYLPVYVPSAQDKANAAVYAENVQKYMANSLGVPVTQHAFEDVALQFQAMKMKHDPEVAVVEWNLVREALDIDAGTAKEFLVAFFEMDTDQDGSLSYEEFSAGWRQKRAATLESLSAPAESGGRELLSSRAGYSKPFWGDEEEGINAARVAEHEKAELGGRYGGGEAVWQGLGEVTGEGGAVMEVRRRNALAGMLFEVEMQKMYDIFCGGERLDFQRFLTGLGVLRHVFCFAPSSCVHV
ncbi:unnamed protein product [Choristocarpus tenellus]